jgi:hypothetical protein
MKTRHIALIATGAVLVFAESAFAAGPPAGVPVGPPAFVTLGPPPAVTTGPPPGVALGPPPVALTHIPSGVPLGKPVDPSTIGTTVRDSARANRAALDHANAQAVANANENAGLVPPEPDETPQ